MLPRYWWGPLYTKGLSAALAKLGAEPIVITHTHAGQPDEDEFEGVKVRRLKGFVMPRVNRAISAGLARRLHECIKFGGFDVVHGQDIYSSMALLSIHSARKRKIPSVLTCHSVHMSRGLWRLVYQPLVMTMCCANHIIAVSNMGREFCRALGVPNHMITVTSTGVDLSKFNPNVDGSLIRNRLGLENAPLVATAIRLIKRKGPDYLVSAFSKVLKAVPGAKLAIAGWGPEAENLRIQIKKLGIEKAIIMLGPLPHNQVAELMAAADVFVLPSIIESSPLAALEAMAIGTPVVCPRAGGVPEIIVDGFNGLMFTPADDDALADAIVRPLVNKLLADQLRENGLKTVQTKFSWEIVAGQTLKIYEKICKKTRETISQLL